MHPVDDSTLRLHWRGALAGCNFRCGYCPFALRRQSREEIGQDARALARFVEWAEAAGEPLAILFTPWGEALAHRHYGEALVRLSRARPVRRVAIQTNLSAPMPWLGRADPQALALWCSYHPGQIPRERFLRRLAQLRDAGVRFSVGMVGDPAALPEIEAMRAALPPGEYLWINALDPRPPEGYRPELIERLTRIDPHFPFNLDPPPSLGAPCRAGHRALSVNGAGEVRPCHFVDQPLGNLYDGSFRARLHPRSCPQARCDCFIGYVQREDLPVARWFGDGVMERVWARAPIGR